MASTAVVALERKRVMVGCFHKLAAAAVLSLALAGCAGGPSGSPYPDADVFETGTDLQCVPYARQQSHVALFGDAYTWWDQAAGRYSRGTSPSEGSVMVLYNYAGPNRAHLAVVREIVGDREIRIDHANWLDDGAIYTNDPVRDVSPGGDWSQVRVFNIKTGAWGSRVYPVQGFIGPDAGSDTLRVAQNQSPGAAADEPPADSPDDPIARLIAQDQDAPDGDN